MYTSQVRKINNIKELTILRLRHVNRKECRTIVYGVGTDSLLSILFNRINWLSSPDLSYGMCS